MTHIKNKKTFITKNNASVTMETAILISTILIILFALISSFMLFYQKALLVKVATKAAQQGAEIWVDSRKQMDNGSFNVESEQDSIYYRIFEDALFTGKKYSINISNEAELNAILSQSVKGESLQEQKFSKMIRLISNELNRGIMKPSKTKVDINFTNLIQRKIEVTLTQTFKIPAGFLIEIFGNKGSIDLSFKGIAFVTEPAENIRNIDLSREYFEKLKKIVDIEEIKKKLKGSGE